MVKRKGNPAVGDVIVVPVSDGRAGVGQVLEYENSTKNGPFFFGVFDFVLRDSTQHTGAVDALQRPMVLFALTLDALIFHGVWEIADHAPVVAGIPWPAYKFSDGSPTNVQVSDHRGGRQRKATEVEELSLPFKTTVAPIRVRNALEAHLDLQPWDEDLSELRVDHIQRASEVLGSL